MNDSPKKIVIAFLEYIKEIERKKVKYNLINWIVF